MGFFRFLVFAFLSLFLIGCKEEAPPKSVSQATATAQNTQSSEQAKSRNSVQKIQKNYNEEKTSYSSKSSTKQSRQSQHDFGNYDNIMSKDSLKPNKHAPVDYYALALSYSPAFCDIQRKNNRGNVPKKLAYQCDSGNSFHWVIHGLWPQNASARNLRDHPRYCQGDLPMLDFATIEKYLPESPGAALLQGEWEKHGACAFDNAEDYFEKQKELYNELTLPTEKPSSRVALFNWMRQNNPHLENIYLGAKGNELYICYDKHWQPMNCPKGQFQ